MSRLEKWRKYGPDARTFLAAMLLLLVFTLRWGFVKRVQQADELIEQTRVSAQYAKDLRAYIFEQQQEFSERERAATRRSKIARDERERLQHRLDQILAYLRDQGLEEPVARKTTGGAGGRTTTQPPIATSPQPQQAPASKPQPTQPQPTQPQPQPSQPQPSLLDQLLSGTVPQELKPGQLLKDLRPDIKPGQNKKAK